MPPSSFKLRPSSAATWLRCHGYIALTHGLAELEDEDDTVREEGTACHWLAHQRSQGFTVPAGTQAPNSVHITEEMQDAVDLYFAAVAAWGVGAWFELPVWCKRIHAECGGTLDVGAVDWERKVLYVGDLKFGYRFVDVVENPQLTCYIVGLAERLGIVVDLDWSIEFMIVQPRSFHREGTVRRWRVPFTDLRTMVNHLSNAAHAAMQANATCTINNGCKRCAANARCETLHAGSLDGVEVSLAATPHDLPFAAAENELRMMQRARDILDARVTGLEQQVMHGMRKGAASRHFSMEQSLGRKAWKEGAEPTIRNLGQLYGVQVTKDTLITPTQAEKLLPPATLLKYSHRPHGAMKLTPIETTRVHRALSKGK